MNNKEKTFTGGINFIGSNLIEMFGRIPAFAMAFPTGYGVTIGPLKDSNNEDLHYQHEVVGMVVFKYNEKIDDMEVYTLDAMAKMGYEPSREEKENEVFLNLTPVSLVDKLHKIAQFNLQ